MRSQTFTLALGAFISSILVGPSSAQAPALPQANATAQPQPKRAPLPHDVSLIDHKSPTPNYHYSFFPPIPTEPAHPNYYEPAHKTVMRHNLQPASSDSNWGVRNPGGVGRMSEYYPPGEKFQNANARVPVAKFDEGGGPNRAEQQASQALGIQRANSIQNNINHYAGGIGYGFGFGFGGGFPN